MGFRSSYWILLDVDLVAVGVLSGRMAVPGDLARGGRGLLVRVAGAAGGRHTGIRLVLEPKVVGIDVDRDALRRIRVLEDDLRADRDGQRGVRRYATGGA